MRREIIIRLDDLPKFIRSSKNLYAAITFSPIVSMHHSDDVYAMHTRFYSEKYSEWIIRTDEDDQCWIRTSKNADESIMGYASVEHYDPKVASVEND